MIDHSIKNDKILNNKFPNMNAKIEWESVLVSCDKKKRNCKRCKDRDLCNESSRTEIEAFVKIHDCNDYIKLDFNLEGDTSKTETYRKNNLFKITCLIRELKKFKKEYLKQIEILKDNVKKEKELEKS